jgi:hypothetical protein
VCARRIYIGARVLSHFVRSPSVRPRALAFAPEIHHGTVGCSVKFWAQLVVLGNLRSSGQGT